MQLSKKTMISSAVAIVAVIVIVLVIVIFFGPRPSVAGKWHVIYSKETEVDTYTLQQDSNGSLTGEAVAQDGESVPLTGNVTRKGEVKVIGTEFGTQAIADGHMDGSNKITGSFDAPGEPPQTFTATRIK